MLNKDEIIQLGLIENSNDKNFKSSSYDLTVDEIYIRLKNSGKWEDSYAIPSQGMVYILAKEKMNLPGTITGQVLIKTSLSKIGILAINIGTIDPGYDGYISTILLNFGKTPFRISRGDSFLKVAFDRHGQPNNYRAQVAVNRDNYKRYIERDFEDNLAGDFLNNASTVDKAVDKATSKIQRWVIASFVIFFTFIALHHTY